MKTLYYTLIFVFGSTVATFAQQSELVASTDPSRTQTKIVAGGLTSPHVENGMNRTKGESTSAQERIENKDVTEKAKADAIKLKNHFEALPRTIMPPPRNEPPYAETR